MVIVATTAWIASDSLPSCILGASAMDDIARGLWKGEDHAVAVVSDDRILNENILGPGPPNHIAISAPAAVKGTLKSTVSDGDGHRIS